VNEHVLELVVCEIKPFLEMCEGDGSTGVGICMKMMGMLDLEICRSL
jgi:hypothetical protein